MKARIAAVQYMLRTINDWDGFENQVRLTIKAAAKEQPHFVLLPENFTNQLLSFMGADSDIRAAVRRLHDFTPRYIDLMAEMAREYRFYLIAGSHLNLRDGLLYNSAFLFSPQGEMFMQDKIHRTRMERERWDTAGGDKLHLFQTDYGAIAILICYDIEFPELARQVCEAGADIIFVPSFTGDRQGNLRVRYCAQARTVENQVYVAMTGTVGSLPVEGLGMQYGQASIMTPSDFSFPRDGIAAEGVINTEQIVVADVDLDVLARNRRNGSTIPLRDKRPEVYRNPVEIVSALSGSH
ncbi:MAG: carbon-nitrogen hydrolase family protein [Gallionella sp.]|nr:carbon-nitrogen hydrolase family protein [Gallionella sp.]